MPYLQVDIDAIDEFDGIGKMAGLRDGDIAIGLLRLWRHCWKTKTAHITKARLRTFFPGDLDELVEALVAGEFLDRPNDQQEFHIRGAEKRLGLRRAQSEAGKNHRLNLKQFTGSPKQFAGSTPAPPGEDPVFIQTGSTPGPPGPEPVSTSGSTPALTSSIQHPTSNKKRARAKTRNAPAQFFDWAQAERERALPGKVPEGEPKRWEPIAVWYPRALEAFGGDLERLKEAYRRFLREDGARKNGCPFAFFISDSGWRRHDPGARELEGTSHVSNGATTAEAHRFAEILSGLRATHRGWEAEELEFKLEPIAFANGHLTVKGIDKWAHAWVVDHFEQMLAEEFDVELVPGEVEPEQVQK